MTDPYLIIREYLNKILAPDPFFVGNGSHFKLMRLYNEHGKNYVTDLLDSYFEQYGPSGHKDPLNKYGGS